MGGGGKGEKRIVVGADLTALQRGNGHNDLPEFVPKKMTNVGVSKHLTLRPKQEGWSSSVTASSLFFSMARVGEQPHEGDIKT